LHDAFERAPAALVEVQAAAERLDAHLEVVNLDPQPRRFDDQVVNHLVEERVHFLALPEAAVELGVHLRLNVQRVDDAVRVEEQLQHGVEQLADEAEHPAVRLVQRRVLELVVRWCGTDDAMFAELLDQIGAHAARVEELLELHIRELLQLGLGVVHAALLADAGADLAHDLLYIDRIRSNIQIGHLLSNPLSA
jgi:hypothetical protein